VGWSCSGAVAEVVKSRASSSSRSGWQAGVAGELGAVGFEAEAAVEAGSEWFGWAVTHEVRSSNWQEVIGNPEIRRVLAQLSCRFRLLIWEIRGNREWPGLSGDLIERDVVGEGDIKGVPRQSPLRGRA